MTESSNRSRKPIIAITMGDPAGIGPEVVVRSMADDSVRAAVQPIVVGDKTVLENTIRKLGSTCSVVEHRSDAAISSTSSEIEVIDLKNCDRTFEVGAVSKTAGKAAGDFIEKAFHLWRGGEIDAICTAPINKESMNLGGYDFPGHTEFFAALAGVDNFAMSFFAGDLRVVLLSTHLPLIDAVQAVNKRSIAELIGFTDRTLSELLKG